MIDGRDRRGCRRFCDRRGDGASGGGGQGLLFERRSPRGGATRRGGSEFAGPAGRRAGAREPAGRERMRQQPGLSRPALRPATLRRLSQRVRHDDLVVARHQFPIRLFEQVLSASLTSPHRICTFDMYIMEFAMKQVNVTTLRQNLPEYLAMVAEGESLSVTLRGRVIAEIKPPLPPSEESSAARARLRGSLVSYAAPLEPVMAADEWEMNR